MAPFRMNTIKLPRRLKRKKGQTLMEYALILAVISAVAIAVMLSLTTHVKAVYTVSDSSLSSAQSNH